MVILLRAVREALKNSTDTRADQMEKLSIIANSGENLLNFITNVLEKRGSP